MDIEDRVLDLIIPPKDAIDSISERASRLKATVEDYLSAHGYDVEVRFAGSFSKGTFLSDPDLDLFLMFPDDVSEQDMKRIGLQAGEDILHGIRMFSDHPYTRGTFEGLEVDMVPCFRVDSTEHMRSAVDRTPFHTRYIISHLDDAGRDQVRLLKKFMKGIGAYGAEQDSRGFSGYLCELLIVRFGTFRGVLESARRWKPGTTIAIEGAGPRMEAPLVVYDPVDPRRNVASAVHLDTMSLFMAAARAYLLEPKMEFFFPNPRRPAPRKALRTVASEHGSRLLSVVFDRPEGSIEDVMYSQLWKTQLALTRKLDASGFDVLRAAHGMTDGEMWVVIEMERDSLPRTHRHQGPPAWVDPEPFLARWRGNRYGDPFIDDGAWVVLAERPYTDASDLIRGEACRSGIGRGLDISTMRVLGHSETLAEADRLLLTGLLMPMMPWENRRQRIIRGSGNRHAGGPVG